MKPLQINVRQGTRYQFKTHINEMLLPREAAEGIEAFHVIIDPGKQTHAHVHEDTEQLYYVIAGRGRIEMTHSDESVTEWTLAPQDVVYVPRNTRHQVHCIGHTALRYLCVDGFPLGTPAHEPTWDDHYRAVVELQTPHGAADVLASGQLEGAEQQMTGEA